MCLSFCLMVKCNALLPDDNDVVVTMTPLQADVGLGDKTADLNRRSFESSSRLQFSLKAPLGS